MNVEQRVIDTNWTVVQDVVDVKTAYSFEYMSTVHVPWLKRGEWRGVKSKFSSLELAANAAGIWMRVCFDHNCPVAVRLIEVPHG